MIPFVQSLQIQYCSELAGRATCALCMLADAFDAAARAWFANSHLDLSVHITLPCRH